MAEAIVATEGVSRLTMRRMGAELGANADNSDGGGGAPTARRDGHAHRSKERSQRDS